MKAQEIKDILASCGWTEDRFGHMKKDLVMRNRETKVESLVEHRIKFQKISLRFERAFVSESPYSDKKKEWFLKVSVYLKDVKLDDTGALAIANYRFKAKS